MFDACEENIFDDAEYLYDYFNKVLGIDEKDIIIFGRSMGSGPATHSKCQKTRSFTTYE